VTLRRFVSWCRAGFFPARSRNRCSGALLLAGLLASNSLAQSTNTPVTLTNTSTSAPVSSTNVMGPLGNALPALSWVPPADSFDWIQIKSGEWLKGELKAMQDRSLDFYSEELDDQSFDWKDIRQVRSARLLDVRFENGEQISGTVTVDPDHITVVGAETLTRPRSLVLGLTPGGERELNYWSGKISLGLNARTGNSDQIQYSAQAYLQRRTPATRYSLDYLGNVGKVDGVENANNHRLNAEFDVWLSQRFYLIVPFAEYYRDPFQNIGHRVTVGSGVGYDILNRSGLEWNVTTGPAYQYVWYDSTLPGEPEEKGAAAMTLSSRFDWDITRKVELILEYRGQYTSKEAGETTHHSVATLSLELTKRFDLDVSLVWDHVNNPKTGADGIEPKQDDFTLIVSLGVDF